MLEYYQAFADYEEMMEGVEALLRHVVTAVTGGERITVQGVDIDFGPGSAGSPSWRR
jgi:lysyl-tRNA synthetase, class II